MCECQKEHIIVNFIILKLKNKHISLKKYADWAILGHVTQNFEYIKEYLAASTQHQCLQAST